jgi:hypothetical protein
LQKLKTTFESDVRSGGVRFSVTVGHRNLGRFSEPDLPRLNGRKHSEMIYPTAYDQRSHRNAVARHLSTVRTATAKTRWPRCPRLTAVAPEPPNKVCHERQGYRRPGELGSLGAHS